MVGVDLDAAVLTDDTRQRERHVAHVEKFAVEQRRHRQHLMRVVAYGFDELDNHRRHRVKRAAFALDDLGAAKTGGVDHFVDHFLGIARELRQRDASHAGAAEVRVLAIAMLAEHVGIDLARVDVQTLGQQ